MKTLIYALATNSGGTTRLADALAAIGLEGGHEVIGMHVSGSARDIGLNLHNQLKNSSYPIPPVYGGDVGDKRVAVMMKDWITYFAQNQWIEGIDKHIPTMGDATMRFLQGDGHFFDINGVVSHCFPLLDSLPGIETRKVHLVIDPRFIIRKNLHYGHYKKSGHYGGPSEGMVWPPEALATNGSTQLEKCCAYWTNVHTLFLQAGAPIFKVEDYNDRDKMLSMLSCLYPEATSEQENIFTNTLYSSSYKDGYRYTDTMREHLPDLLTVPRFKDWNQENKNTLYQYCGNLMEQFGYTTDNELFL